MRRQLLIVSVVAAVLLGGAGCLSAPSSAPPSPLPAANVPAPVPPGPSEPKRGAFGTSTIFAVDASARFPDGLTVRLVKIDDSRCPQGVQCVWQGEIAATFDLEGGDVGASTRLVLGTVRAPESSLAGYAFALSDAEASSVGLTVTKPGVQLPMDDLIRVTAPRKDDLATSPLAVTGEARGTWYFEATFPVKLLDADGKVIAATTARAQGDWMTRDFVPFKASLSFAEPSTATGTLVLEKDNPSGMPENAASVSVPVRFTGQAAAVPACKRTGCSGEICADKDVVSDCAFRPEFACYKDAVCARQKDGACGWTQTAALTACLDAARR